MTSAPVPSSLSPALGLVAGTAAVALAWLGGSGTVVPVGLVTASLAAAGVATVVPLAGAMTSALLCWAIYDGFAVHRFGELQLSAADLRALAIVATAACLTQVVADGIREIRADLRPRRVSHCRSPRSLRGGVASPHHVPGCGAQRQGLAAPARMHPRQWGE